MNRDPIITAGTPGTVGRFESLRVAIARAWQLSDFHRRHWLEPGVAEGWVPEHPLELERLPVVTK